MRVLGIETSCDETSAAVLDGAGDDTTLRSLVILSQDVHRIFGGVVPEIASRAHLTAIVPVVASALRRGRGRTGRRRRRHQRTGARGRVARGRELRQGARVRARRAGDRRASHGRALVRHGARASRRGAAVHGAARVGRSHVAARRRSVGSLPVARAARATTPRARRSTKLPSSSGCHILGARTSSGWPRRASAVRTALRARCCAATKRPTTLTITTCRSAVSRPRCSTRCESSTDLEAERGAIARAFQDALIDTLVEKTARAVGRTSATAIVLGGGVACNGALVAAMRDRFAAAGFSVFAPSPRLATDNAAMIARAGLFHLERGERSALDLNAFAAQPIPGLVVA